MNVEAALCKAVCDAFNAVLTDVECRGNWLPAADGALRGTEERIAPVLYVDVDPRKYDSYTGCVGEIAVTLECEIPLAFDPDLAMTNGVYERMLGVLEAWRDDIAAVKRDLTCTVGESVIFDPVGLRLDGGTFEFDASTKNRIFKQQFTTKGRIR